MVDRELKRWATKEFNYPPNKLPPERCLRKMCAGQRSVAWKYITQRVLKKEKVEIRRKNVDWYRKQEIDELKKAEVLQKRQLQAEILELRGQIRKLDMNISVAEEDIVRNERASVKTWSQHEGGSCQELLLQSFLQRQADIRTRITEDTQPIREQRLALEKHLRNAEVELLYDLSWSGEGFAVEPLVMHEMRQLCKERVQLLKVLHDEEGEEANQASFPSNGLTPALKETMEKNWCDAVKTFLQSHPPSHVLSAFHVLNHQQQRAHQQPATPQEDDFRCQDERQKQEIKPSVKMLFQSNWADAEQAVLELIEIRSKNQQLKDDIRVLLDTRGQLKHPKVNQHLQWVAKEASVRSMREQCSFLEEQAMLMEEDTQALHQLQASTMEMRKAVAARQKKIQELITLISLTQREIIKVHSENRKFLRASLFPQCEALLELIGPLTNLVSDTAHQFSSLPMAALDCRTLPGEQRIPASQLSIFRANVPEFYSLHKNMDFPLYKTPTELLSHATLQRVELRRRRNALRLLSSSSASIRKAKAQLPLPDCQGLLERVRLVDEDLQRTVLPRTTAALHLCTRGLETCEHIKTAIKHWWEQPAQFVLPDVCLEGKNFMQWLYRYQQAAKKDWHQHVIG